MRVLLKLKPQRYAPFNKIGKHTIQGMLYANLIGTKYEYLHEKKGFKFFTFSDIFPAKDFYPGKIYNLIVSSPDAGLIRTWYNRFEKERYIYLSDVPFKISQVRIFNVPLKRSMVTGSPIVLYEDSNKNIYFSFRRSNNISFFLSRLKDNALKKFNAYYDDEFQFDEEIFDRFSLKKEVAVKVTIEKDSFDIIGSVWYLLGKGYIESGHEKFYKFVMDCGLGEKNSLGFGMVNPVMNQERDVK